MAPSRWLGNGIRACLPKRPLHMALYSTSSRQVPAEWLRRVLEDRSEPPKLYAWTPANLPNSPRLSDDPSEVEGTSKVEDERRRIYVLGIGNMGRLYASFLAKNANRPPITLVVHRKELLEHWRSHPGIELTRYGKVEQNTDFDIEWWTDTKPSHGPIREPGVPKADARVGIGTDRGISNLIVATKAADALPEVDRLRRYLGPESTVAFTQNGICKLWPPLGDAYIGARFPTGTGPAWLACVTMHGVISIGPFRSVHASPANALVGTVIRSRCGGGEYLAEQIANAPGMDGRRVETRELWVAQLEKLVVNAVINPLTAVLRCKNGVLFEEKEGGVADVIDRLLQEASRTLTALMLHQGSDEILLGAGQVGKESREESLREIRAELVDRFSFTRLRAMLYGVAPRVGENTSSMLQDVQAGKKTEIEDFNGWLVETARYLGDDEGLPAHEKLIALVEDGVVLTKSELRGRLLGDK